MDIVTTEPTSSSSDSCPGINENGTSIQQNHVTPIKTIMSNGLVESSSVPVEDDNNSMSKELSSACANENHFGEDNSAIPEGPDPVGVIGSSEQRCLSTSSSCFYGSTLPFTDSNNPSSSDQYSFPSFSSENNNPGVNGKDVSSLSVSDADEDTFEPTASSSPNGVLDSSSSPEKNNHHEKSNTSSVSGAAGQGVNSTYLVSSTPMILSTRKNVKNSEVTSTTQGENGDQSNVCTSSMNATFVMPNVPIRTLNRRQDQANNDGQNPSELNSTFSTNQHNANNAATNNTKSSLQQELDTLEEESDDVNNGCSTITTTTITISAPAVNNTTENCDAGNSCLTTASSSDISNTENYDASSSCSTTVSASDINNTKNDDASNSCLTATANSSDINNTENYDASNCCSTATNASDINGAVSSTMQEVQVNFVNNSPIPNSNGVVPSPSPSSSSLTPRRAKKHYAPGPIPKNLLDQSQRKTQINNDKKALCSSSDSEDSSSANLALRKKTTCKPKPKLKRGRESRADREALLDTANPKPSTSFALQRELKSRRLRFPDSSGNQEKAEQQRQEDPIVDTTQRTEKITVVSKATVEPTTPPSAFHSIDHVSIATSTEEEAELPPAPKVPPKSFPRKRKGRRSEKIEILRKEVESLINQREEDEESVPKRRKQASSTIEMPATVTNGRPKRGGVKKEEEPVPETQNKVSQSQRPAGSQSEQSSTRSKSRKELEPPQNENNTTKTTRSTSKSKSTTTIANTKASVMGDSKPSKTSRKRSSRVVNNLPSPSTVDNTKMKADSGRRQAMPPSDSETSPSTEPLGLRRSGRSRKIRDFGDGFVPYF